MERRHDDLLGSRDFRRVARFTSYTALLRLTGPSLKPHVILIIGENVAFV
jgi:hypothetical protein